MQASEVLKILKRLVWPAVPMTRIETVVFALFCGLSKITVGEESHVHGRANAYVTVPRLDVNEGFDAFADLIHSDDSLSEPVWHEWQLSSASEL